MAEQNKKLTVLIDMDDTIEYLLSAWLQELNEQLGTNVKEDDIHDYDITKAFPGFPPYVVYAPLYDHELWRKVKPVPGARYAIERMLNDGHDVYIVTSSNFQTIHTKIQSIIRTYFPMIDDDHIIIAKKKQMIRGDVLIDDAPHNLVGGEYLRIMPTAAHNRDFDAYANKVIRASDWSEIYNIVFDYSFLIGEIKEVERYSLSIEDAASRLHMTVDALRDCVERWVTELAFMDTESK